jgi:transcriptional regulator with GAF, ATPase, and Fis domain
MSFPGEEGATKSLERGQLAADSLVIAVLTGQARGTRRRLGERLSVGAARDNDLVLPDDTVSRHHCELVREARGVLVRDLGSTNQTRVGQAVVREAVVEVGTTLSVGGVELMLQSDATPVHVPPSESPTFGQAIGPSLAMRRIFGVLERIAPTDASVTLEGETGTGKDVLARSIHDKSARRGDPFVVVDCGAVSYNLIESELFGHERGAFTGAVAARQGAFELAGRGTLFLDEIGELPLDVQPKLLRVLESGDYRRVGGNRTLSNHARIVAATKRNLKEEVARGKFREDLYFRLSVVPITVPSLRQRREDIPPLVEHFLTLAKNREGASEGRAVTVSPNTMASLCAHDWPGNVRELRNVLDRAVYLARATGENDLRLVDLPVSAQTSGGSGAFDPSHSYRDARAAFETEFERRYVTWLLERHEGNVSAAAREARMDRKYLSDLAKKHGLRG